MDGSWHWKQAPFLLVLVGALLEARVPCLSVYWPYTEISSVVTLFSFPYLYNTLVKPKLTVACHLVSYNFMESFKVHYHKNHFSGDNSLESKWFRDHASRFCLVSFGPILLSYTFQETCILHPDLFIKNCLGFYVWSTREIDELKKVHIHEVKNFFY